MNTREREVMDALAHALTVLKRFAEVGVSRGPAWDGWEEAMKLGDSARDMYVALLAEGSASSEGAEAVARRARNDLTALDDADWQEKFSATIQGAMAFGAENVRRPPAGHWLTQWWELGRRYAETDALRHTVAVAIARELARMDGFDPDDKNCGLYELCWSGGSSPEPLGDAWNMDYLPDGERLAKAIEAVHPQPAQGEHEQRSCEGSERPSIADEVVERALAADERMWALIAAAEKAGAIKDDDDEGSFWTLRCSDFAALESALPRGLPAGSVAALWPECHGCGSPLLMENLFVDDGCPCNSPRGVNLTPKSCGICGTDNCVKPGHRIGDLFGLTVATAEQPSCGQDARDAEASR